MPVRPAYGISPDFNTFGWVLVRSLSEDDDGMELFPPMFAQAMFRALGEFEEHQSLVCPIWEMEAESENETYCVQPLLSDLHTHCPSFSEVFLRRNFFIPSLELEAYEH